jgi:hypothetical protein
MSSLMVANTACLLPSVTIDRKETLTGTPDWTPITILQLASAR